MNIRIISVTLPLALAIPAMASAGVPPSDRPLIKPVTNPRWALEAGAGVLGYTGGTAAVGPAWNVRATAGITARVSVEGNYVGSVNKRPDIDRSIVLTAADAGVRYDLPHGRRALVVPFVVGGVGISSWAGSGGDGFALTVPVSVGADRMLTRSIKIGARAMFRPSFFDNLGVAGSAKSEPGGDTWGLLAHLGGAF